MSRAQKEEKPPYSGYFLAFEPRRTEKILVNLHNPGEASESFSAMDWTFERREVALLSLTPGEACVDAIVLMDRMHGSGGTGKLKMRMWSPILINRSIKPGEMADAFNPRDRICTAETFRRIPHTEWLLVLDAIKHVRPEIAGRLDTLLEMRGEQHRMSGDDARTLRLVEQRDAIGLILDMATMDRQTILRAARYEKIDAAQSALDILDHEPLQEQDLIRKDQAIFGKLLTSDMRGARFVGPGGREVRVHVYDKKPLETVLGIDLLIYQEAYRSFLLLQYKNMKAKSDDEGKSWSYLVDPQLQKQIQTIERAVGAIQRQPQSVSGLMDWRLNSEAFYFKFCESTRPDARDDALVAGITIGYSHLKQFLGLPESIGEHGGQRIGYHNCPRYLNNTQFVDLARDGWIGCDQQGFALISDILAAGQEGGKVAMLAVIDGTGPKTAVERRKRIR